MFGHKARIQNKSCEMMIRRVRFSFWLAMAMSIVAMATTVEAQAHMPSYDSFPAETSQPKVKMEFGIGLDATYTNIADVATDIVGISPRIGFGGHFDMAVCIGRNFAIGTEIAYQRGKAKISDVRDNIYTLKTRTIDVPILLSLRVANQHLRFDVGPMFTVMSKAQYDIAGETREFGPMYPTWNLVGGVGVCIGRHFVIEAKYIHALKTTYNQIEKVEFTTRAHRITAGFTVVF